MYKKRLIICILLSCFIINLFPLKSYAASAPSISVGTVPYLDLPQSIQKSFENGFYEAFRYLFSGDEKKEYIIEDEMGRQHKIDQSSLKADWEAFLSNLQIKIDEAGNNLYNFAMYLATPDPDIETAWDNPIFTTVTESVCEDLSKQTEEELLNPVKTTIFRDAFDNSNNVFKKIEQELDLIDNGVESFSDLKSRFGFKSVNKIEYNNFNFNIQTVSTGGNSTYCTVGYLIKENDVYYLTSPSTSYSDCGFCLNPRGDGISSDSYSSTLSSDGSLQLYHFVNGSQYPLGISINTNIMATPYLYMFVFDDGYQKRNNLTLAIRNGSKIAISADQINDVPGINFDTKSDLEKAAEMLAEQLGVDINRILDEFKLVVDENGERYLENSKGIRTSLEDLVSAYNESIAGNQAIINNLEKLLEQLKAQDISGLESYVSSIESTLDDLNQRDKDREAVYGDIVGTLGELRNRLGELNLDELGVISNNIADIRDQIIEFSQAQEIELDLSEGRLKTPSLISTKFPFSIPFDIYNLFNIFSASPKTPEFDIPLDMTSVGGEEYNIHVDLSYFDTVANVVRWLLYGVFVAGLILVTNKLIGRG